MHEQLKTQILCAGVNYKSQEHFKAPFLNFFINQCSNKEVCYIVTVIIKCHKFILLHYTYAQII